MAAGSSWPELDSDYALTREQISRLRGDGHILLPRVASPEEIAVFRPVILAAHDKHGEAVTPLEERDTYGRAGDATFHHGWTLHRAPGNSSFRTREVMTIIWFADGTCVGPLDNPNRQRDRDLWLPGLHPGDLAAGELNPLVYKR